ncbi:hypothetical protein ACFLTQ_02380 [Chloroflexota bacterium]
MKEITRTVVKIKKIGFILSDGNTAYTGSFVGLVPQRVRSGKIPYTTDFDIEEIAKVLIDTGLTLKDVFVITDKQKEFTSKIPDEIRQKVSIFKDGMVINNEKSKSK